ncbi:universal stress protein [Halomicrococcus sp. SG-WS-1]|uniref:universal stress protein n=1 Tax=Halomicrococcus sp. SG-WS-1 TaxID=3439057 RepID=UPI003F7AA791
MFDEILIAVDGSDNARRAATFGFALADAYDATVDLLYAYRERSLLGRDGTGDTATERGQAILDETAELAADRDVAVETHVVEGRPAKAITGFAADRGTDLVVVGRKGRVGVGRRLLGSVTEQVLRRIDVPVLVVPGSDSPGDREYERVLATTDGSEAAEWAAPYAGDLANRCGAALHLLTVVDLQAVAGPFDAGGVSKQYIERLEEQGREALDRFEAEVGDGDHESAVVRGTSHRAIREYVEENDVDLVVMASRGQSGFSGQRLGSVTGRVLRVVDVPVLVVTSPP